MATRPGTESKHSIPRSRARFSPHREEEVWPPFAEQFLTNFFGRSLVISQKYVMALTNKVVLGPGTGPLWYPPEIFDTIAAPLRADKRYRHKVYYSRTSMCIKVELGIKVEILPVVYRQGNQDPASEPFYLFRPQTQKWELGFARYHQSALTTKNQRTAGNFIPAIKVFKHLRSHAGLDIASFHIECFLHVLPDDLFAGSPAEYIPRLLQRIASTDGPTWWQQNYLTPCGDRIFFHNSEWTLKSWLSFYQRVIGWSHTAQLASAQSDPVQSRILWQVLLGDRFPVNVT